MLENISNGLPKEKKRIANELLNNNEKYSNISLFAKKINTSPSMVTRTLKEIGFYGWKDYQAFILGSVLQIKNNISYFNFYKKNIFSKIENMFGYIDPIDIDKIVSGINKYRKIIFVFSIEMKSIVKLFKSMYRMIGVKVEFVDSSNDNISLIEDESTIFFIRKNRNLNSQINNYIKENLKNCVPVCMSLGDLRKNDGKINLYITNNKSIMQDEVFEKIQFRNILTSLLDMIYLKFYSKYIKNNKSFDEVSIAQFK